jgi:hypothetical protein
MKAGGECRPRYRRTATLRTVYAIQNRFQATKAIAASASRVTSGIGFTFVS